MNAPFRLLLLTVAALLLLLPSLDAAARERKSTGSGPARYSLVAEYKEAYARPRPSLLSRLLGKRKTTGARYARKHRTKTW